MGRLVSVVMMVALGGCYAEVGTAFYPVVDETVTPATGAPTRHDTRAWSVTAKLGFYLDIPIRPWRTAIGVGVAPGGVGGESINPAAGADRIVAKGTDLRLDVAAPVFLFGRVQPRLSLIHTGPTEATVTAGAADSTQPASGRGWFVGVSAGGTRKGSTILLGLGVQGSHVATTMPPGAQPATTVEATAWGFGARLLVAWTPSGTLFKYYRPSDASPQPRANAGCYYADHCDGDGHCTTQYVCP